jgi:hypothetical protein
MRKLTVGLIAVTFLVIGTTNVRYVSKIVSAYAPENLWPYTLSSTGHAVVTPAQPITVQDQDPQPPESSKHCERPNPNNPKVGDKDKDKIGCTCMRKCVAGKPIENYENGKQCVSHCKPDQCDCPNPCKT